MSFLSNYHLTHYHSSFVVQRRFSILMLYLSFFYPLREEELIATIETLEQDKLHLIEKMKVSIRNSSVTVVLPLEYMII